MDVGTHRWVRRVERRVLRARGEIVDDRRGLPEHKIAVFEHGHLAVGVHGEELRAALPARREIHLGELQLDAELAAQARTRRELEE